MTAKEMRNQENALPERERGDCTQQCLTELLRIGSLMILGAYTIDLAVEG